MGNNHLFNKITVNRVNAPEEPRLFPSRSFESIEPGRPVGEEELPDYQVDRFYPVQLSEAFQSRYQTVAKLAFGASSTSWLARDLK